MKITSGLVDPKVRAVNIGLEISVRDYWSVASKILDENELQRRKVVARGKPYQLLQRDLIEGCVMPPIILALKSVRDDSGLVSSMIDGKSFDDCRTRCEQLVADAFSDTHLIILDGLQRT